MIRADNPVTPLRDGCARRPITCSLCGSLLGAWYQYQYTFYPHFHDCTERCEGLLVFADAHHDVPRGWREYPNKWRAPLLASALVMGQIK